MTNETDFYTILIQNWLSFVEIYLHRQLNSTYHRTQIHTGRKVQSIVKEHKVFLQCDTSGALLHCLAVAHSG